MGIGTVGLFVTGDGALVLNELTLGLHNAAHATIKAGTASQFHDHPRAVLDWPFGGTSTRAPAG